MKKVTFLFMLMLLSMSAFAQYVVENEGTIKIKNVNSTLLVGDMIQISVDNSYDGMTVWTSDNESVATISEDGWLNAIECGNCKIRATALSNPNIYDEINIKIIDKPSIENMDLNGTSDATIFGYQGHSLILTRQELHNIPDYYGSYFNCSFYIGKALFCIPSKLKYEGLYYNDDMKNDVTCGYNGVSMYFRRSGRFCLSIRCRWQSGGISNQYYTYIVKVVPYVSVENVTLNTNNISLEKGNSYNLKATVSPNNASEPAVTWSSSNEGVATVDQNGNVSAKTNGTAYITVTSNSDNNKKATCQVNVITRPQGVFFEQGEYSVKQGESLKLNAIVFPDDATNKSVTWQSYNNNVATIDGNGNVYGVAPGSSVIIVKTVDGNYTDTCRVTVINPVIKVNSVTLDKTSATIKKGETLTLKETVLPEDATNKSVTWSSNNTNVATVDNGVVTGVKSGTATITVKTNDGGYTATCVVTVIVPVNSVKLDKTSATIKKGETLTLKETVLPEDATNKSVTWSSNNTNVATVSNGVVTGVKSGTATITVKTNDGGYTATCVVTVIVPVNSVKLDKTSVTIKKGETLTLKETVLPENATNKSVTWSSNNTNVATVSNGVVTGVKSGTATITVKTNDGGYTANCVVTVIVPVESVKLDVTNVTINQGETLTLKETVLPEDAIDKSVIWSSDSDVATVDNGLVKGIKLGTATITVKTNDGGFTATCVVTVKDSIINVTGVKLNKSSITIYEGETCQLYETVLPENATNKNVTWKSSKPTYASVTNGLVTGFKKGTAYIYVKTLDGAYTAKCKIIVKSNPIVKVSGVKLNKSSITIYEGKTYQLNATVLPINATNKNVTWKSSKTTCASVTNGLVTGLKKGTAYIYVKTLDGAYTAKCKVIVK